MVNGRIMIVEDEGLVAEDLAACIAGFGYEVVGVASSAAAARALAETQKPDLALLDIQLRGEADGIALAQELRRHQIGFVYLTAHSDERTLERAQTTEPLGYVLKPFGARDMLPVLQTALYRHSAEVRLRGMEHWLSTTLRSIGDGVLVTDVDGRVTFMNRVAEGIAGVTQHDAVGRDLLEILPFVDPHGAPTNDNVAARAIAEGATVYLEPGIDLVRSDGSRIGIDDCASPIRDDDGKVTGAVVVFRDATERRRVDHRRQEADRRVIEAEKLESLAVVAGGLAHDLNNVLTSILGNVALCRHAGPAEPLLTPLHDIESGVRTAAELCRRMLNGLGACPVAPQAIPLGEVVAECLQRERTMAAGQIGLHARPERTDLAVMADPVQLRQVIGNLVRNAVEALAGRRGEVVVRAGAVHLPNQHVEAGNPMQTLPPGDYVWIEVADDGPGMPADVKARVFEPFFTTKIGGRGLGLANVHSIVRRHHGAIGVESEPGIGTVFRVLLPSAGAAPAAADAATPAPQPTVLVVDDDEAVRNTTMRLLSLRRWQCHGAASGAEAMRMLRGGLAVDGVVLDALMPSESGIETLAAIRAWRQDLPVLLVSGLSHHPDPGRASDPATAFLAKPFRIDELTGELRRLMRPGDGRQRAPSTRE